MSFTQSLNLSPQEAVQLSELASDDFYVQKQKEDIQELASMFRDLMGSSGELDSTMFLQDLRDHFHAQPGFRAVYKFNLPEAKKPLIVKVDHTEMECYYGDSDTFDVEMQISSAVMNEIVQGRMTFQRAFMAGDMKMKGDFKELRTLDMLYVF